MNTCRSCGAELEWALTAEGHRIPLDKVPVPDGNIVFDYERPEATEVQPGQAPAVERRLIARVLKAPELARLREESLPGLARKLYKSHFATCPDAARYRKPKAKKKP
jgi:hypothetical protein